MRSALLGTCAALLHMIQSLVVFGFFLWNPKIAGKGVFAVTRGITVWRPPDANGSHSSSSSMVGNFSLAIENDPVGSLDVKHVIAFFFLLSAMFQGAGACMAYGDELGLALMGRIRMLEYSVTASLMVLAIMCEVGLTDAYLLAQSFVLTMACMLLGLIADALGSFAVALQNNAYAQQEPVVIVMGRWMWALPHGLGWVCVLAVWAPILDAFMQAQRLSSQKAPDFVLTIVCCEALLFMSFGFVQLWSLSGMSLIGYGSYTTMLSPYEVNLQRSRILERAEMGYVVLSLVAKTLLGWLIMSPILASAAS
jgi:hypothetical protein